MVEWVEVAARRVISTFHYTDLIDVVVAAAFIYVFVALLRQSAPHGTGRRILVVILLLVGSFALADTFDLYLVQRIVQALLVIALLGAVVVFQADLRRMVDRLGELYVPWRGRGHQTVSVVTDKLTEALTRLAETRTGALVALRGDDSLDRHVEGGVELEGRVSLPLLYSIFDASSPGHDGAVLLEGDRIARFGVHLPLSSHAASRRQLGTRHAAALGLSEVCDALVLVVSEERGVVSVAEKGDLTEAAGTELKERLDAFWEKHYAEASADRPAWWRRQGWQNAVTSLLLAVLLWFIFAYNPNTIFRTYTVPIEFRNVPSALQLQEPIPSLAQVTLTGPEQAFRQLDPSSLTISISLSRAEAGMNTLTIGREAIRLPATLDLYGVDPEVLRVEMSRRGQTSSHRIAPPAWRMKTVPRVAGTQQPGR